MVEVDVKDGSEPKLDTLEVPLSVDQHDLSDDDGG